MSQRWSSGSAPGVVVILAVLLGFGLAAAGAEPRPQLDATGLSGAGLVPAEPAALPGADDSGAALVTLDVDGQPRAYVLAPARAVPRDRPPALVVVLPPANRGADEALTLLEVDLLRDHGATVALPAHTLGTWNAGWCCGEPTETGVDDAGMVAAVVEDALGRSGADPDQVALLGYSTGAFMVYRMLCDQLPGVAAAVAVAGTVAAPCPALDVLPPVLALHGALDRTVPARGLSSYVTLIGTAPVAAAEAVRRLALAGGCPSPALPQPLVGPEQTTLSGCAAGGPIRFEVVADAGHRWEDLRALSRSAGYLAERLPSVR